VTLAGSEKDSTVEPYHTMNTWFSNNMAAINEAQIAAEVQVSSWAIVVEVTTVENTVWKSGDAHVHKGWGYLHEPSVISSTNWSGAVGWQDTAGDIQACLPVNWNVWSDVGPSTSKTGATHLFD